MAELRLTPAAESDLENTWRYTALRWSSELAQVPSASDLFLLCRQLADDLPAVNDREDCNRAQHVRICN